jgi:zinc-ribbon domain
MFCPQCGTESSSGQQYCRMCGANLKFIGKAVTLSEAVARSDRGPLPKIKEMMQSMKGEQTTEEVSHALDQMNNELVRSFPAEGAASSKHLDKKVKEEPPELRRENHLVKGMVALFSGIAIMIFLYYFSAVLVLKIPPEALAKIPFEVEPVVRMLWLIGLIPTMSGLGRIIAGFLVRPAKVQAVAIKGGEAPEQLVTPARVEPESLPGSVTEGTTELLDNKASALNQK